MKNIVIAEFKHETNRFCPIPANETAYRNRNLIFGEEIFSYFKGVKNEIGGFLDVFRDREGFQLIPAIAGNAMPSGPVTMDMFYMARDKILEAIRSVDHVDGVLLSLHGAMVLEEFEDGEGLLLETVRNEVGPDVPIIVSLDLHVNMTKRMQKNGTAFFVYDYYPHTDMYDTGVAAAEAMYATLSGKVKPVMRWYKMPFLQPCLPTADPVIKKYVDMAQEMRQRPGVLRVNICSGFFQADIEEMGVAVIAVTDDDAQLAQDLADELGKAIWADRANLRRRLYTADEAIDEVLASAEGEGPFVLADVADNPGAGGSADTPHLLRRLIERDVQNVAYAIICDPEAVIAAEKAGVGNMVTVSLGGKTRPDICGEPVVVEAYVKSISDGVYVNRDTMCQGLVNRLYKTAVLRIGGVEVIVSSNRVQPWDLEVYRSQGIMPQDKKVLVTKSTAHFRASFGTVAYKILDVEAPGLAPQDPKSLAYQHCPRPMYPLDEM